VADRSVSRECGFKLSDFPRKSAHAGSGWVVKVAWASVLSLDPASQVLRLLRSVVIDPDGTVRLVERQAAPATPAGDLVQAGPLLVADGTIVFDAAVDREGFSAGAGQFDSDITEGRYPRAALGISEQWLVAVACDGRRSSVDGGLSMLELAEVMVELGATSALNLDGGGSTTLVHRGHLLNRPYSTQDQPAPASRRVVSALTFEPQA
jgi:exopolysaccharide biosynthesis protein